MLLVGDHKNPSFMKEATPAYSEDPHFYNRPAPAYQLTEPPQQNPFTPVPRYNAPFSHSDYSQSAGPALPLRDLPSQPVSTHLQNRGFSSQCTAFSPNLCSYLPQLRISRPQIRTSWDV